MYKRHAVATGIVLAGKLLENNYNYIFCPGSGAHHGRSNIISFVI